MACNLTDGRKEPFKDVVGWIKLVYFINYETLTFTESSGEVTDIQSAGAAEIAEVYK